MTSSALLERVGPIYLERGQPGSEDTEVLHQDADIPCQMVFGLVTPAFSQADVVCDEASLMKHDLGWRQEDRIGEGTQHGQGCHGGQ